MAGTADIKVLLADLVASMKVASRLSRHRRRGVPGGAKNQSGADTRRQTLST